MREIRERRSEKGIADVLAVYPAAYAFQWTGSWRIYRGGSLKSTDVIGGPCRTEARAWEQAARKLAAPPEDERTEG